MRWPKGFSKNSSTINEVKAIRFLGYHQAFYIYLYKLLNLGCNSHNCSYASNKHIDTQKCVLHCYKSMWNFESELTSIVSVTYWVIYYFSVPFFSLRQSSTLLAESQLYKSIVKKGRGIFTQMVFSLSLSRKIQCNHNVNVAVRNKKNPNPIFHTKV